MSIRAALSYAIAARLASVVLMAASVAILGRLLDPEAFGHFAVALSVWGFCDVVVQFGLRQLIISRAEEPDAELVAEAAGLSLCIAAVLSGAGLLTVWAFAGSLIPTETARALVPALLLLLVSPFTLATEAMLQRSVAFRLLSVREVVRVAVDLAVAVPLALAGFGAVALAGGMFLSHLVSAILLILAADPKMRVWPRLGDTRHFLRWGREMTLIDMVPRLSEIAMISGLAALQGSAALGLFNRARTVHKLLDRTLLEGIKPVILPAFSGAMRAGTSPGLIYRTKLDYMTAICWPAFALIALHAHDLVRIVLGPGWSEAVPAVRILALMAIPMPLTKMSQKLFVALGVTGDYLRIEAWREGLRVPLTLAGAAISLEAFALAFALGSGLKAWGVARYLHRRIGGPEGGYSRVLQRGIGMTVAALAGPVMVTLADPSPALALAMSLPLALAGWFAAAAALDHPVFSEAQSAARYAATRLRRS